MSESLAQRRPWLFHVYYAAVILAAAAMLIASPWGGRPALLALAIGGLLMLLNELVPVELPGGGYATASAVVDLPCLVILGPAWTALIDVLSTFTAQAIVLHKPPVRVFHNMAIAALTELSAGAAYRLAGGSAVGFTFAHQAVPLLVMGATYFVVNAALASTIVGIAQGPSPWRVWERNFQHGITHHLSFIALGAVATVTYFSAGPGGLVLFAVPFLVARESFRLYVEIRSDLKAFVRALTEVLEEVDPYTRHHSMRVAQYAVRLARGLGLPELDVEDIEYAALVHDLGKIGPQHQHILQKPGSLSHEEQRTLREHPATGAAIVKQVRALRRASEIILSHHERPDGQGYPYGLRAEDVPLGARILNVSDAFDAMTSDRPYRRALSMEAALGELKRGAGTQFDAGVVQCLVRLHATERFRLIPSPSSEDLLQLRIRPLRIHR
jgi:putative nucleotidyltransferase with HDIG domain